jgi:hypothetical protein
LLNLKIVSALVVLALLGSVALGVAAYVSWSQSVTWTYEAQEFSFTVDGSDTWNMGVIVAGTNNVVQSKTYTIANVGNVPITVVASATFTGATYVWDKAEATIAVDESTTFTLTVTVTGAGSGTVSFAKKV